VGELAFVIVFFAALTICGLAVRAVVLLARGHSRRSAIASLVLFGIGVLCFLWGLFVEPHRLEVTEHVVETTKLAPGVKLRIAHVSDLHVGIGAPAVNDVARLINEHHVDLLVFTGDAVNGESFTPEFHRVMEAIDAPRGKFGVRGNHDRQLDMGAPLTELTGVPVTVGDVVLCGAAFWSSHALAPCIEGTNAFTIAAFHSPDLVETTSSDLYLAGHTHGGQVRLPFFGATITMSRFGKKYEMGRYQVGATTLYVNRGVGVSPLPAPPIRFLCRPEVAIIDVIGASAPSAR
jgi:uncharacterized protein